MSISNFLPYLYRRYLSKEDKPVNVFKTFNHNDITLSKVNPNEDSHIRISENNLECNEILDSNEPEIQKKRKQEETEKKFRGNLNLSLEKLNNKLKKVRFGFIIFQGTGRKYGSR